MTAPFPPDHTAAELGQPPAPCLKRLAQAGGQDVMDHQPAGGATVRRDDTKSVRHAPLPRPISSRTKVGPSRKINPSRHSHPHFGDSNNFCNPT